MPDMAGEAIFEEVNHPHAYRVIHSFLRKCTAALVLIDAARLRDGQREQDYFTMKLLSYLRELNDDPKRGWARRPVALVLTKADQCDGCQDDPEAFARAHAAGLWQQCRDRFRTYGFFAAGVAGACAFRENRFEGRRQVPLRIEPHGIIEPFEWLLKYLT